MKTLYKYTFYFANNTSTTFTSFGVMEKGETYLAYKTQTGKEIYIALAEIVYYTKEETQC